MATKTVSTSVAGFVLNSTYTVLSVTGAGTVTGVAGTIGASNSGSAGTAGTVGVSTKYTIAAYINGLIKGGVGGAGGTNNGSGKTGGTGGAGAVGAYFGGGGTLTNTGTIIGGAGGAGGGVSSGDTNGTGGVGGLGLSLAGKAMTVMNTGSVALISGGAGGVAGTGGTGGAAGAAGAGISILAGGAIINGTASVHTSQIKGTTAIYAGSAAAVTVTNFASIAGSTGNSVTFKNNGDRLITETSAVFTGAIAGGGGALEIGTGSDTIAALGGTGTLSGSTTGTFSGFGSYQVDSGASATLTGTATLTSTQKFTDNSALTLTGTLNNAGSVAGASTVTNLGVAATGVLNNKGTISGGTIGVSVAAGGYVSNLVGSGLALISGTIGVYAGSTGAVTVSNSGKITGASDAVQFKSTSDRLILVVGSESYGGVAGGGGTLELKGAGTDEVTNLGGGSASFVAGVNATGLGGFTTYLVDTGVILSLNTTTTISATQTVTNNGSVDVAGNFSNAGQITSGTGLGALGVTTSATITNTGSIIAGTGGTGINISTAGATITNGSATVSSALIKGAVGIYEKPSVLHITVTNWATIQGTTGDSVNFGSSNDRLIVESGAYFIGLVAGGGGSLEFAAGTVTISGLGSTGTLSGAAAASFSNFGKYTVDAGGAAVDFTGANSLASGKTLSTFSSISLYGSLANSGVINGNNALINDIYVAKGATLNNSGLINGAYKNAVSVAAGGTVVNFAGGSITGNTGVYVAGAATLTNAGTVNGGHGNGVLLASGASVINTGTIIGAGSYAGVLANAAATVTVYNSGYIENGGGGTYALKFQSAADRLLVKSGAKFKGKLAGGGGTIELVSGSDTLTGLGAAGTLSGAVTGGSIAGFGSYQVDSGATLTLVGSANTLLAGRTLTNKGSVLVTGSLGNLGVVYGPVGIAAGGTLTNSDTIQSTTAGVTFTGAGTLVNTAAGLVEGATGVYANVAGTVVNAGTIEGVSGDSVQFTNSSDRLIVQSGGTFVGAVAGGGGALEIASGSDTITGLGGTGTLSVGAVATFSGFGSYSVTNSGTLHLTGSNTLASGQTLANPSGRVFLDGALANAGRITSSSAGGIWVDAGGTLQNSGSIVSSTYGVQLNSTVAFTNAVAGYISAGVQGVVLSVANATVVNYGVIKGGLLDSVNLTQSSDKLVVESGSTLVGLATAVSGGTLELGGGAVTLSGLGNTATLSGAATGTFTGFSNYTVDAGATLTLAGFGNTLTSGKSLSATSVTLAPSAYLANRGQFSAGLVAGTGATVSNVSTVTGAVSFSGAGELIQRQGGTIGGSVSGGGGTLQIASGYDTITGLGGAGTLSGMGSDTFSGFGTYLISSPATLHLTGSNTLAAGQSIANPGGRLFLDGTLGNAGTISDVGSGGIWVDAYGVLNNSGTIQGGSYGVSVHSAHAMTNAVGGYIGGSSTGVVLGVANATLVNAGSIKGGTNSVFLTSSGDRLVVESGSTLTGLASANNGDVLEIGGGAVTLTGMGGAKATLSGDTAGTVTGFSSYVVDSGVSLTLAGYNFLGVGHTLTGAGVTLTGTLVNAFYISAASGDTAVSVATGGVLKNNGTIVGGLGAPAVYGAAGATVTNNGTISGAGGAKSVDFGGAGTLIAGAYSKFVGSVAGGGGRLELAGGADTISGLGGAGTITGTIHANFGGFGSYKFDSGASITITGVNTLASGVYMNDVSLLNLAGKLTNSGTMQGGPLIIQNLATFTNTGTFGTNAGIGLSPGGVLDNSGAITMTGGQPAVVVGTIGAATLINSGTITAGTGDAVDLNDKADRLVIGKGADFVGKVVASGGVLEVSSGSDSFTGLGVTITASGDAQGTLAGFGGYRIDSGATVTVTGAKNTIDSGVTVANYGVLDLTGSLTNDGYIFGDDAMDVGTGGSFTNHGSLASASGAVIGISGGGQVTNLGGLSGTSGAYGVSFSGAGTLINGSATNSTAYVLGSFGVYADATGAATVTNYATIRGGVYAAVFKNKADRLIVESGAYFESGTSGGIAGGGATLELAGGSDTISSLGGTATLSASAGGTFSGFGTYVVDSGVVLTLSGVNTLASGKSLIAPGTVYLQGILTNSGYVGGGAYGVIADIASTVANYGTINGSTDAVKLTSNDDRLIVGYGSSFGTGGGAYGTILGGGGRMEFAGGYHTYVDFTVAGLGTSQGTLSSGSSGYFSGFGHYTVDAYAHLILTGANTIGAAQSVYNNGQIELSGDLTNAGTLQGHAGVSLDAGSTLTNTGQMFTYLGPVVTGGGVVINSSTIDGHNGANAIEFRYAGAITNQAGGYIFGAVGVYARSGYAVTVTNAGTISGRYTYAVEFNDPTDRLIVDSGAHFYHGVLNTVAVAGGGGTLELAGGSDTIAGMGGASDTLSGSATGAISDFGAYQVDSGVSLTLAGYDVLNGSLIGAGTVSLAGTLVNLGYIGGRAVGVSVGALSTLTNYGTIEGATYSVELTAASADMRVGAKAKFIGLIDGGGGGLEITGGTDTLTGLGGTATLSGSASGTLSGFDRYVIDITATLFLSGANTLAAGAALDNSDASVQIVGSLANYGTISGGHGIQLISGGSLFNDAGISTNSDAVGGSGSIRNAGTIRGHTYGVSFSGAGYLLNEHSKAGLGTISGNVGVYAGATGAVTVSNAGTIQGTVGDSVQFKNTSDRLILDAGATFIGSIAGGGGALEIRSGYDTISGLGGIADLSGGAAGTLGGFGAYVIDGGASLTLTGGNALASGHSITNYGALTLTGTLVSYGQIYTGYGLNGITVTSGGSLSNKGVNTRIVGGAGVNGDIVHAFSQPGGNAGAAVYDTGGAVYNSGTLQGGQGGYGGLSTTSYPIGGAGGAGVDAAASMTLVNKGGIYGGLGGTGGSGVLHGGAGGAGGAGVELQAGGRVVNYHTIKGGAAGAPGQGTAIAGSAALGAGGAGLDLANGGTLINETAGVVSGGYGGYGVYAGAGGVASVINFGTIRGVYAAGIGYGGYSVVFENAADLFVAESGSSLEGWAYGGGGTFEFAGTGSPTGTIHGLGSDYATLSGAVTGHIGNFGTYVFQAGGHWTLTGVNRMASGQSVSNAATLTVADSADLQLSGSLNNTGLIVLSGAAARSDLVFLGAGATFGGGGLISMSGIDSRIYGVTAGSTLTNADIIDGQGAIVMGSDSLINDGVIRADGAYLILSSAYGSITNNGLIEASSSGSLLNLNRSTIGNASGTILALQGAHVQLRGDDIVGGTIGSSGTGAVNVIGGNTFDGSGGAVTVTGLVQVLNGGGVHLSGAIANTGKINLFAVAGSYSTADIIIATAGATLSGGGQINMSSAPLNRIYGQTPSATLTNVDNRIAGSGLLGDADLTLVNEAGGAIVGNQIWALVVDTGANTIINQGLIESAGPQQMEVKSALNNTGTLLAAAGILALEGAVTGAGVGRISGGRLYAESSFTENVSFGGTTGVLELHDSVDYTGQVTGLSRKGTSWLDLDDIGFSKSTTATFSGTSASGVLTVTDGTHTAHITLIGDYLGSTFTVSAGAHGGTKVVDPAAATTSSAAPLVQAMSSLGAASASASAASAAPPKPLTHLLAPPA